MTMAENKRGRSLALLRILFLETSARRPMEAADLLRRMAEEGFPLERKSLYKYIEAMNESEIAVRHRRAQRGLPGGYWYAGGWLDGTEPEKEEEP